MLKYSPIFRRNGAHLVEKKTFEKKNYPLSKFECFEHAKTFLICVKFWPYKLCNQWKIFQIFYDNPNRYVSLVIFQTYKKLVLKSVHSLGWFLWLCFYPRILVRLTSYARPIGPTFILIHLASFVDLVNHARDHINDHEVIFSDKVVELSDF